jgi:hypothetical protein
MNAEVTWRKIILQLAQRCWELENRVSGLIDLLRAKGISISDAELTQAVRDAEAVRRDTVRRACQSPDEFLLEDLMKHEGPKQ